MRYMESEGFTLIELLVVVAIIAIIAAILFPVFSQAKREAMKTSDISALKNMGVASGLYLSDYDGFELAFGRCLKLDQCTYWKDLLAPYLNSEQVFLSSDAGLRYTYDQDWVNPATNKVNSLHLTPNTAFKVSFGYNSVGYNTHNQESQILMDSSGHLKAFGFVPSGPSSNGTIQLQAVNESSVVRPSETIRIASATVPDIISPIHTDALDFDRLPGQDWTMIGRGLGISYRGKNGSYGEQVLRLYADSHVKTSAWGQSKLCNWLVQGCPGN